MDLVEHTRRTLAYLKDVARRDLQKISEENKLSETATREAFKVSRRLRLTLNLLQGRFNKDPVDDQVVNEETLELSETRDVAYLESLLWSLEESDNGNAGEQDDDGSSYILCHTCKRAFTKWWLAECSVCLRWYCFSCFGIWTSTGFWRVITMGCCKMRQACTHCHALLMQQRKFHHKMVAVLETGISCLVNLSEVHDEGGDQSTKQTDNEEEGQGSWGRDTYSSFLFYDFDDDVFVWRSAQLRRNMPLFEYFFNPSSIEAVKWNVNSEEELYVLTIIISPGITEYSHDSLNTQAYLMESRDQPVIHREGLAPMDQLKFSYILGKANANVTDMQMKMKRFDMTTDIMIDRVNEPVKKKLRSAISQSIKVPSNYENCRVKMKLKMTSEEQLMQWRDAVQSAYVVMVPH